MKTPEPIQRLINSLATLPGIGPKTAARLTFFLLRSEPEISQELAHALMHATSELKQCSACRNYTTTELCSICQDPKRDATTICIVETISDLWAMEDSNVYKGHYHVLHGSISPLDGIGPDQLQVQQLLDRIKSAQPGYQEAIIATNSDVNGETTAIYLSQVLSEFPITLSRIASGIPTGGGLEYVDRTTLEMALNYRRSI